VFSQDLNYAIRSLRKTPIFTAAVLITTALGIGANTAMFSVIHAVLLKPLTYPEPDRVVQISEGATAVRFRELRSSAQSYSEVGAVAGGLEQMNLSGNGAPEVFEGARVSANFLDVLRVSPLRGRSFFPDEDKPGAPGVAMISARLWQRRFGGDPMIVGKTVALAQPLCLRWSDSTVSLLTPLFSELVKLEFGALSERSACISCLISLDKAWVWSPSVWGSESVELLSVRGCCRLFCFM